MPACNPVDEAQSAAGAGGGDHAVTPWPCARTAIGAVCSPALWGTWGSAALAPPARGTLGPPRPTGVRPRLSCQAHAS